MHSLQQLLDPVQQKEPAGFRNVGAKVKIVLKRHSRAKFDVSAAGPQTVSYSINGSKGLLGIKVKKSVQLERHNLDS